ncbi:hypothetical protein GCM10010182_48770 [Actinomadura cremea]|nr:hypothetical protein GCM10010182_48770 [Actinomadura cremea]
MTDASKVTISCGSSGITRVCCTDTTIPAAASATSVSIVCPGAADRGAVAAALLGTWVGAPVMGVLQTLRANAGTRHCNYAN